MDSTNFDSHAITTKQPLITLCGMYGIEPEELCKYCDVPYDKLAEYTNGAIFTVYAPKQPKLVPDDPVIAEKVAAFFEIPVSDFKDGHVGMKQQGVADKIQRLRER